MNEDKNQKPNLWFGFALGAASGIAVTYLFGTKKGRENLRKLLEMTENLEEDLGAVVEEFGGVENVLPEIVETIKTVKESPSVENVMNKIKGLTSNALDS